MGNRITSLVIVRRHYTKPILSLTKLQDTFLRDTGLSNHPAVFDYHYKLGLAMGDDTVVKDGAAPAKAPVPVAHEMYPNEVPKE